MPPIETGDGPSDQPPIEPEWATRFPECNKNQDASWDVDLQYMITHYSDAASVANTVNSTWGTNIDANFVIGWAAAETGWSGGNIATSNSNYFNESKGSNWINQGACKAEANTKWACFSSFSDSALAAFFSPLFMTAYQSAGGTVNNPSAGFILADQLSQGATLTQAFQNVASGGTQGGFDRNNSSYGTNATGAISAAKKGTDCLRANGYIK
jgi:hypothetical protein